MTQKVFITGIAGFIGFHLASLLVKKGYQVGGIDNFNNYYTPLLKEQRATILKEQGISIESVDLKDAKNLQKSFQSFKPDYLIHLAAQAGVRYSIKNPQAYVDSNLIGFFHVLELCRQYPNIPLIFASSSSVYGLNKKTPFSENDLCDQPVSLYGATKKSNELLAFSYHHLYRIPMIGLRFFTVYGPYGRPDMAYFSFAQKMLRQEPIEVFNHGKLARDFTYIEDITKGIAACLERQEGFEIFNLGNHQPQTLEYFIQCLEKALGIPAVKKYVDMQAGDVLQTYADISLAKKRLNFNPKTSLEEGIFHFVKWFKNSPFKNER